jgi:hypothetical protein
MKDFSDIDEMFFGFLPLRMKAMIGREAALMEDRRHL